jgi:hypothetical protein
MEMIGECHQNVLPGMMNNSICLACDKIKHSQDTLQKLQARITELENELQQQRAAAERGDKLVRVMWGDNFSSDSLF